MPLAIAAVLQTYTEPQKAAPNKRPGMQLPAPKDLAERDGD